MYNEKIKTICKTFNIDYSKTILFLTALYHDLDHSVIDEFTRKQVYISGMISRDYMKREIIWEVPLYSSLDTDWNWLQELANYFVEMNPSRSSDFNEMKEKVTKLMVKEKISQADIYDSTMYYLKSLNDPTYLQTFSNFIEKDGKSNLLNIIRGVKSFNFS